jgi:two-component system, sensor histidine kinase YcbA
LLKNEKVQILLIALSTAIAGEFKVVPFSGENFRFGLGSSVFFLLLLLMRRLSSVQVGIATGLFVLLFRMVESFFWAGANFSFLHSLQIHGPALLYYLLFGIGLHYIRVEKFESLPFAMGAIISLLDFFVNGAELLTRKLLIGAVTFSLNEWSFLFIVAVIRSFFVIGLFSSINISHMRALRIEEQKRLIQMLKIGSGLYGETLYLKKSMDTIETITSKGYELYLHLKNSGLKHECQQALHIAQQIHEVKKDSQRILAGLVKLFDRESVVQMYLSEIAEFVVSANQKYGHLIGKEAEITKQVEFDIATPHYLPLLTVLNNLVSNAVEALDHRGIVQIGVVAADGLVVLSVRDNGKGIVQQDLNYIFEPGFTTKFDEVGIASTGIGLSHVREIVRSFQGDIEVFSAGKNEGTIFTVRIPKENL